MRNDIIKYLQEEVYRRCKQPTNKFGMYCRNKLICRYTRMMCHYYLIE